MDLAFLENSLLSQGERIGIIPTHTQTLKTDPHDKSSTTEIDPDIQFSTLVSCKEGRKKKKSLYFGIFSKLKLHLYIKKKKNCKQKQVNIFRGHWEKKKKKEMK